MKVEQIQILIDKYLAGEATFEERTSLEQWYERVEGNDINLSAQDLSSMSRGMKTALQKRINPVPVVKPLYIYMKWAAAILIITAGSALFYLNRQTEKLPQPNEYLAKGAKDIPPGGNKALLTLADGSTVLLNDAVSGKLVSQGGASINKAVGGLITYVASATANNEVVKNTLSTPRGGKYTVILSDGTKVWLNAATTLKYPAVFVGHERRVELSGEAYFEVAKNPNLPFRVISNQQTIEVLGTHFDISAYEDEEQIKSTLLEGSIKVSAKRATVILSPGQQSVLTGQNNISVNTNVNTDEVTSWRNDLFQFESADIKTILNQFSRWYDVDVIYEGEISEDHYHGTVSRNLSVSQALKVLNLSGIKFKIEGKKIIVK